MHACAHARGLAGTHARMHTPTHARTDIQTKEIAMLTAAVDEAKALAAERERLLEEARTSMAAQVVTWGTHTPGWIGTGRRVARRASQPADSGAGRWVVRRI